MHSYIRSVGTYLPEKIVTNDDLAKTLDTSDEWVFSHTGIHERRVAADDEAASDLGFNAAIQALNNLQSQDNSSLSAADIDLILVATSTPDYLSMPSTACIVQDRLAASNAGAMDLIAACTGFIYALETAKNFIESGSARNVLVIGSEVYSKIVNWKDRSTCILFGDGAGAVILGAAPENSAPSTQASGIFQSILRSKGDGAKHLLCPAGGTRNPYCQGVTPEEELYLHMNGRQVYVFAVRAIIETVDQLLDMHGLNFDDIDHVVPHQANRRIIEAACKRKGWPEEKFFMNMDRYANTSSASIPIAMDEMLQKGLLKRGDRVLTIGFGAGLTFGGNYFIW